MPRSPSPQALPSHRDPALDGLRGLAVLLVFFFHYGGGLRAHNLALRTLGFLSQAGWIGVDLFFALSGFLITGLLAKELFSPNSPKATPQPSLQAHEKPSGICVPGETSSPRLRTHPQPATLRNFYARRGLRILPLYFAALLSCALAARFTGSHLAQLKPLLLYAAFLQNLPPLLNTALHTPPPLPVFHLWSLAVEEQFYLLWPLALLLARTPRRALHLALATFAASVLFRAILFAPHVLAFTTAITYAVVLPTRAGALALGSALALHRRLSGHVISTDATQNVEICSVSTVTRAFSPTALALAIPLSIATILLAARHTHTLLLNNRLSFFATLPAADVLSAATVALALQPTLFRRALSSRSLTFLGQVSYGFYVLHILLEPLFDRLGTLLTHSTSGFPYQAARLLTAFPITLAAATLSFRFFEQPFLRLKGRFPYTGPQTQNTGR